MEIFAQIQIFLLVSLYSWFSFIPVCQGKSLKLFKCIYTKIPAVRKLGTSQQFRCHNSNIWTKETSVHANEETYIITCIEGMDDLSDMLFMLMCIMPLA